MVRVGVVRWFCRGADDWNAMTERLKLTPCPYCNAVGTLIRHGYLYGYVDSSPPREAVRGRRIFCSNRQRRPGCGRTVSVFDADRIRGHSLSTGRLWQFLAAAVAGSIHAAIRAADGHFSDRTWLRLWQRFDQGQSRIRTALLGRWPPPELPPKLPAEPALRPAAHVVAHLVAAFPDADCPIAAFQHTLQTCFV